MRAMMIVSLSACLTFLSACVVVVDNDHDDLNSYDSQHDTPRIGVELTRPSAAAASQAGADASRSCLITGVTADSPAAHAGVQKYDIVTAIDGRDYATRSALREAIKARKPGETITLTVVRAGQKHEIPVTVGEW